MGVSELPRSDSHHFSDCLACWFTLGPFEEDMYVGELPVPALGTVRTMFEREASLER